MSFTSISIHATRRKLSYVLTIRELHVKELIIYENLREIYAYECTKKIEDESVSYVLQILLSLIEGTFTYFYFHPTNGRDKKERILSLYQ